MKIITKVLQALLILSVLLLVFCWTFVATLNSNQKVTELLENSGFYQEVSVVIVEQISAQLVGDTGSILGTKKIIEKNISGQSAKAILQPMQIAVLHWITGGPKDIKLELDLESFKSDITVSMGSEQRFMLTKILPDNIQLDQSTSWGGYSLASLRYIRSTYELSNTSIPILTVVIISASIVLLITKLRHGSKKFTIILSPVLLASSVGLVLAGISYILHTSTATHNSIPQGLLGFGLVLGLLVLIILDTLWIWIILGLLSISGIIISRMLFRAKDKKLKERYKQ